jgi:hypothetical protein
MKTTRRQTLLLVTASVPMLAAGAPQAQPAAKTPEEELEAARKSVQQRHERLAKVELKNEVEPAFVFRAG